MRLNRKKVNNAFSKTDLSPKIINDDPGLTLTYFTTRSNLVPSGVSIGKKVNSVFIKNSYSL